jgi:hypothetical protein
MSGSVADDLHEVGLLDSATHSTCWGGMLFVPVAFWTPENWGRGVPPERLDAYSTAYLPSGMLPDGENWLDSYNALWVRARLPVALGFAPPTCRRALRWQFLNAGMLAVCEVDGKWQITPFICTDDELRAELRFGRGCVVERRRAVAAAFWGLLASYPTALASYRDRFMYSDGHDVCPTVVGYWRGLFHLGNCRW